MGAPQGHEPAGRIVDRWVRVGPGRRWAGYTLCGVVGLTAALVWTLALADDAALVLLLVTAMAGALLATAAVEALAGRPRLVCLHAELAALAVAAGTLALTGRPVLASLDVAVPGLALFLACGRVGCLVAGCCHGRPAARGVRYGPRHLVEGLPAEYVGVALFPVPAVEAVALVAIAGVTTAVVLDRAVAGAALAVYLVTHLAIRFWLEFLRGDDRPHLAGLSEAQWTALAGTVGTAVAVTAGRPLLPWWLPTASATALGIGVVAVLVRADRAALRGPGHVREVARVVRCAAAARGGVVATTTTLGVRVSASCRTDGPGLCHYAFSRAVPLPPADVALLWRVARHVGPAPTPAGRLVSLRGVHHHAAVPAGPRG